MDDGLAPGALPRAAPALWATPAQGRHAPLVIAAGPVLEFCAAMKSGALGQDADRLHRAAFAMIRSFETRVQPLGLAPNMLKASKYALCATLDDVAMNSAWGSRSVWPSHSLVGAHFSETWGGNRVFDLLEQLRKEPGLNIDLIELLYCCLSLGFEGRLRVSARGAGELQLLREDLYRLIRSIRGPAERDLSPRWRGTGVPSVQARQGLPLWLLALAAAAGLVLLQALFSALLMARVQALPDRVAALPPAGQVTLLRPAPPPPPVAVAPTERLRKFLEAEIRDGLVSVTEDDGSITVTLRGDGMFPSAEADPLPQFLPVIRRVGRALDGEEGQVLVTGHTDAQPIRTAAFPGNDALSLARARAVAALTAAEMADPGRLSIEGRGASQPVAPNDTEAGRRLNRRTEFVLLKPAP
ncbi:type VI secretion system protein TssL, long form [Poseidonocella sp. HB161398]|uniref:type VI secretion system protein TssL, long form n=1 Tax=Poseidonocella sp. HB161398 TaxID=2320855 RepID=UPI0014875FA7|nr:type VI secretion system protein TssL, long form [Poseidonocella sp. HB161398]